MISSLQAYNVYLQYINYVESKVTKINDILYQSIDEELNLRNRRTFKPDKIGNQHSFIKAYKPGEKRPSPKKGESVIILDSFDVKKLKSEGIVNSASELITLITQDNNEAKKNPINFAILDTIFCNNLKEDYEHCFLLLDKDKNIIKAYGRKNIPSSWAHSKDIAVSLAHPKFVRVAISIPPSDFIWNSISTLVFSLLFVAIATLCIRYQLRKIKEKDKLLKSREVSINGIIHDLKAPINSVIALLGVAKLKENDPDVLQLFQLVSEKAKLLITDIENILIAASEGKRQIILSLEDTNFVDLAETAKSDVDIIYKDKEHAICIYDQTNGTAIIKADRMYILHVIRNLIENAVKYADNGVKVEVYIYRKSFPKSLMVSIADNGWGIDKKDKKKIFRQFYRVPHEHGPKGHGIGLALVKYVVEAHGGNITVDSELGKGSTFTFHIPIK